MLDLDSGAFVTLNQSGLVLGEGLSLGLDVHGSAERLAGTFGIPIEQAERDARSFFASIARAPVSSDGLPARNPVTFEALDGRELLRVHGTPMLVVDFERRTLEAAPGFPASLAPEQALRWAAPHLLWSVGIPVLHASAVETPEGVLAFSGASGTGKTTLARMLAAAGHGLVSEDLVVLSTENEVVRGGEPFVNDWARTEGGALHQGREISWDSLLAAGRLTPRIPLARLAFPTRQNVDDFEDVGLSPAEALARLLVNSFAERAVASLWSGVFEVAEALARSGCVGELRVPEGLFRLETAARRYRRTITS